MAPTSRQLRNLRRGGSPDGAARATAARKAQAEGDRRLVDLALADPVAAMRVVHAEQARAVLAVLKSWTAKGGPPPAGLIAACRELRRLSEDVKARELEQAGSEREAAWAFGLLAEAMGEAGPGRASEGARPAEDPERVIAELWAQLELAMLRCSRALRRNPGIPGRRYLEASREFRMVAQAVDGLRGAHDGAPAEEWHELMGAIPARMATGLTMAPDGPKPPIGPAELSRT